MQKLTGMSDKEGKSEVSWGGGVTFTLFIINTSESQRNDLEKETMK